MLQSIAVGCVFLVSIVTLTAMPGGDVAPPIDQVEAAAIPTDAIQLIADLDEDETPDAPDAPPTEPPLLPAPDPFEGTRDPADPGNPLAPNAPVVMPVAEPPPASWASGPPRLGSGDIVTAAAALLGVPYLWGGNNLGGMDCSAYVSRAWGLSRQTTDTIGSYSSRIDKEDLLPGDAMNLTTGQDPRGYGHIRIFAAWANEAHSQMWVYEETPRQSIYHVIAYDARYTPIRRTRMATEGVTAPLKITWIEDRRRAISLALDMAKPGDCLLIAGKGHETYQIIGDTRNHFDDAEEAARCMRTKEAAK